MPTKAAVKKVVPVAQPEPEVEETTEGTTIEFTFEKETKNSNRYQEVPQDGQAPIVGTLYLQKWFSGTARNVTMNIQLFE